MIRLGVGSDRYRRKTPYRILAQLVKRITMERYGLLRRFGLILPDLKPLSFLSPPRRLEGQEVGR